jgi:hypothetical protein
LAGITRLTGRLPAPLAVLRAVSLALYRELRSFHSITGQNFFFLVLFIAYQQVESVEFFGLILGALLFFPLSSDPLEKIPRDRRQLWPLHHRNWLAIRVASLFLSPVIWISLIVLLRIGWRLALQIAIAGLAAHGIAYVVKGPLKRHAPGFTVLHWVPRPPGITGQLMRLHWREMLTTLDPYVGLLLSLAVASYRVSGGALDPAALPVISMVVVVALSTSAQVLIGLDGPGAQRYRLLPIHGWRILLAKDAAYLIVLLILIAPLEIPSGFTSGLAGLTIGHSCAAMEPAPQRHWRFTSGLLWPTGALQIFAIFAIGNAYLKYGPVVLLFTIAAWALSVWWFGRKVDHRSLNN